MPTALLRRLIREGSRHLCHRSRAFSPHRRIDSTGQRLDRPECPGHAHRPTAAHLHRQVAGPQHQPARGRQSRCQIRRPHAGHRPERIAAQAGAQIDPHGLADVRANLHRQHAGGAIEQLDLPKRGAGRNPVDFGHPLLHLCIQAVALGCGVGAVGRPHRQLAHPLQVVADGGQGRLGGLAHTDGVLGVAGRLGQTANLGGQPLGDGQPRRIVAGGVDAKARAQALHGRGPQVLGLAQGPLGRKARQVGVDAQGQGAVVLRSGASVL